MSKAVPGRISSIVNIHNPSIEVHTVEGGLNTGAAIILVAGGGHNTLNVGSESADFVPFFYNYGVNTVILRNRLRRDGYNVQADAVHDALQAIRLVRAHAKEWNIDPNRIGIMGFSAGAELAAPAALFFEDFDKTNSGPAELLTGVSSRPDFVGLVYPGPTPFARNASPPIPRNAPPAFITCAGSGDRVHAIWADEYLSAMLRAGIPNVEMHIYGNGRHPGEPLSDGFRDLGFLQRPGVETKATRDTATFLTQPQRRTASVPADQSSPRTDQNSQIAHMQLLEKAMKGGIDVYFEGDSITRRWDATDAQYKDFVANWNRNFFGWNAANFGWGGDTVQNILWRLRNGELDGVNPKIIVLLAGANNVGRTPPAGGDEVKVEEVTRGIKATLNLMQKKAPAAIIVLMGLTPRNDGGTAIVSTINRINDRIARLADGKNIRYLNINDRLADKDGKLFDGVTVDGLHLSVKGYQIWADALKPVFTELLGPPARTDHAPPPTGDPSAQRPVSPLVETR
jgi:acetyl esterase/lipase/lysophospholipase L1-like esterase